MMADLNSRARRVSRQAVNFFTSTGGLTSLVSCGLITGVLCLQTRVFAAAPEKTAAPAPEIRPESEAGAKKTDSPSASVTDSLPDNPSELFVRLSEATRPQWRQFYRPVINRCQEGRRQAAVALGAVCADLYLASQARDAQQVRNLLQDEATIEKSLGLIEPMAKARQRIAAAADQSQWRDLQANLRDLQALHLRHLRNQKDEDLADFAFIGQWVRCLQICHGVVMAREVDDYQLAIGSSSLIEEMKRRVDLLVNPDTESVRCLRLLHRRLEGLDRLWHENVTAEGMAQRLRQSADFLADTMDEVVQDPP